METEFTTFIHSSDLHLGSHQYQCEERSKDYIQRFKELLLLAVQHQVDFILLGGDVFTSLEILPGHLTEIIAILKDFQNYTRDSIPIIAIEGNHDIRKFSRGVRFSKRGQSWLKLLAILGLIILLDANFNDSPEKMFKNHPNPEKKVGKIRIKNVMIYGTRYRGESLDKNYFKRISRGIKIEDGLFHILIQHFGLHGQMKNVPGVNCLNLNLLKDRVDYLALGHFHVQYVIDDWIYNPGSLEAVSSVDHSFKRGVFLVKIHGDNTFQVKSIQLRNRMHIWDTIFLNRQIIKLSSLIKYVIEHLVKRYSYLLIDQNYSQEKPILYLTLKGQKPKRNSKSDLKRIKNEILNQFLFCQVKIYEKYCESFILLNDFLSSR